MMEGFLLPLSFLLPSSSLLSSAATPESVSVRKSNKSTPPPSGAVASSPPPKTMNKLASLFGGSKGTQKGDVQDAKKEEGPQLMPVKEVRVLYFNIWFDQLCMRERMDAISNTVAQTDPDFICLQEVTGDHLRLLLAHPAFKTYHTTDKLAERYYTLIFAKIPLQGESPLLPPRAPAPAPVPS